MSNLFDQLSALAQGYLPNVLVAIVILVVGWLAALAIAGAVRAAVNKTWPKKQLAEQADVDVEPAKIGAWTGRVVFYALLIFVLAGAFQVLRLESVAGPLDTMLQRLTGYLPQLAGGAILIGVAWLIGSVLRLIVRQGLSRTSLDERIAKSAGLAEQAPLSRSLGDVVFWLTLLLFVPAILGVLELEGLVAPLQAMVDDLVRVLPDLLGATVILLLGWFLARVVRQIVTALLASAGADRLGERVGMGAEAGGRSLSAVIGLIVYALILIPAAIAAFDALGIEAVSAPATGMLSQVLSAIPLLFGAAVLLGIAYLVGRALSGLVSALLTGIGFDRLFERLGLHVSTGTEGRTPSEIAGYLVLVAVILVAAIEASNLLGFFALSELATDFFQFGAGLLLGLAILGVGLYLGNLAYRAIPRGEERWYEHLASAARIAIVVLAATMALEQTGVAEDVVTLAFTLVLGAIAAAVAIAFGLGARDTAGGIVKRWVGSEPPDASGG